MTGTVKALRRMTKDELYREACDRGAGFLANVIWSHHPRAFTKLCGLVALLREGREVCAAQFSLDVLVIDGARADWSALERAADGATA
jgi:hypothetical protein